MNYFRYKQFNKDVITVAVGYYLRYTLSYRDISEILRERGSFLLKLYYKFNFATEPKIISSIYFYMNPVTQ
ncbi:transposase for insertion sequence-like element IS431mec [Staphylococcus aureus W35325]|nr:transposase for insertion sequence-like element IS431mec [Staphylococcus aureus W35325]